MGVTGRPVRPSPVRPQDAASLILLRRGPGGPEVLMGRRAGGHRFLPNVYAFPGGRLGSSDRSETPITHLKYNRNYHKSQLDRKSVVEGKSLSVRVDFGGCRFIQKKNKKLRIYNRDLHI